MKILMISLDKNISDFGSTAGQRMLDYASFLEKLTIIVLGLEGEGKRQYNLEIFPTAKNKILSFLKALKIGAKILGQDKYGLITTQDPFLTAILGYKFKKDFNLPLEIQIHTDIFSPFFVQESLQNKIYFKLAKFFLPKADGIRVVSERIKTALINKLEINGYNVKVLPVFVDCEGMAQIKSSFSLKEKYPDRFPIILMVSRLTEEKNIDLAIDVIQDILKNYPKALLLIVGSGHQEKELKMKAGRLKLEKNIIFQNWTRDVVSFYKGADIYLLTSNYEGYGRTVIEAMACGLPVVMTKVGIAESLVKDGENGIVIEVNNAQKLKKVLLELADNDQFRKSLSEAALDTVRSLPKKSDFLKELNFVWQNYKS